MTWLHNHSETTIVAVAVVLLLLTLAITILIYRRKKPGPIIPVQYSKQKPRVPFHILSFQDDCPFNYRNPYLDGQSHEWREEMAQIGKKLDSHSVSHVYFVHGSFVGDDPFGIIPTLRRIHPNMSPSTELNIRQKVRRGYEKITKDTGNYLAEYVDLFRIATGTKAQCKTFVWSSANHHVARLVGALDLIRKLAKDLPDLPVSHILLLGHSHGGQTFALFSHLVNMTHLGNQLWDILIRNEKATLLEKRLVYKLKKFYFDFVTFGTPYRYSWRLSKKMKLINIINHRGKSFLAEKSLGFWKTSGGDYVQQWGIAGSDSLAASSRDRAINREIDKLLGSGVDPKSWLENMAKGMRVPEAGTTYLVDYRDQSLMVPNFMKTVFGHGVYTKYEVMLFNTRLITNEFYDDN